MSGPSLSNQATVTRSKFFYGWVIVAVCTLILMVSYGLMFSYSVFFKPLAENFNWDRATVSLVYSASLVIRGAISIGTGWLADKYGARKILIICGFMMGLGYVLSSQVNTLWQFFLTYAVIGSIGLSGAFGITTAVTSRWFTKNRGLALGIISSGVGLGTLLIVPGSERLIETLDWSGAFFICGIAAGVIIIICSLFLRPAPQPIQADEGALQTSQTGNFSQVADRKIENSEIKSSKSGTKHEQKRPGTPLELNLKQAIRDPRMIVMMGLFALLIGCTQLVVVHLVNYATDLGITPLIAASFISVIGVSSIAGRLVTGLGADRIGLFNTMIICCVLLIVSLVSLTFVNEIWSFYLFAVVFGFTYGAEVPQMPLFVGRFCGMKAMAALMGLVLFVGNIGGALGPWIGGKIFDMTSNYHWAFIVGVIGAIGALILALLLKRIAKEK